MSLQKTPGGTRGPRGAASSNALTRFMSKIMTKWHRRSGDKFMGMDLLYLTTVGAKSGQKRESTVSRFPDSDGAWLIVASAGDPPAILPGITTSPRIPIRSGSRSAASSTG
jgi:hypothetical protein